MSTTSSRAALPRRLPASTLALSLSLALMLGGCAGQRTTFEPVQTKTPAAWNQRTGGPEVGADQWWQQFGDPALDALIERALRTNNNLAVAAIKVRRAQLDAGLAADARIPTLSATANASNNRRLDGSGTSYRSSANNVSLAYEADLWGRLGANYDVKRWEALATEQDRQSAALTLIGTTANLYWQGAYLNGRIASANESIAYASKTRDLVRTQYGAGAVSTLEILEAEQNLISQQSNLTQLLQQQVENANALAILFDSPPGETTALPARLPQQPLPDLAAGLPADLLGRRPDLRAAEMRLRESLASTDATRTNYYPKLVLTGTLGTSSDALVRMMQNPLATLAGQLTLPFLQWNQMQLNVKISQADYESAVTNFRQTLYAAFGDVENALSARRQYAAQEALLQRNLAAAQGAERLYELRYRSGSATLRVWLDAQESRRTAENSLAEARLNRLKNQMTLYQALGGDARLGPGDGLANGAATPNS